MTGRDFPRIRFAHVARALVAGSGALLIAFSLAAQGEVNENLKLSPGDGNANQEFGFSVALSNGLLAVGARFDDDNGAQAGSAYLYDAATGAQLDKLLAADGVAGDQFGFSIAIDDGLVVIGAPSTDGNGAAFVFDATTGDQLHKLLAADGATGDEFGASVALDNGIVAVGSPRDDDSGNDSGAVYLFDASSGAQIDKLAPIDGGANNTFGEAVAMDNGVVVVGAHGHSHNGLLLFPGAAYLFDAATGVQLAELRPDDAQSWDFFGSAVAIDSGVVAVGAWAKNIVFDHSGAAYVFDVASGLQIGSRIVPADTRDRQHFGISVAVDNGIVAIGAEGDIDNGFEAGAAYLYDAFSGMQIEKLLSGDGMVFDRLGGSISMNSGMVAAGAVGGDSSTGAVYLFGSLSADTDGDGVQDATDNCTLEHNPDQRDTNGDGFGNSCDADLNDDGTVNTVDLGLLKTVFFSADPDADLNGDGTVNALDLGIMKARFFELPGPSGVAP